jgi:hypothetical protein
VYRTSLSRLCFTVATLAAAAGLPAQPACPRGALPAYAHNDYENPRPLHAALSLGYQGAEADVFLVDGELRLGHDRRAAQRGASLEAQYLAPLRLLVARCGSLTADGRPFLLTVEIKERSRQTFDTLVALLTRYAGLFSPDSRSADAAGHGAPPVEVVLVGEDPPVIAHSDLVPLWRQVLLRRNDARTVETTDPQVRLVSLDYSNTMGRWWVTPAGRRRWLSTLRAVRAANPTRRIRVYHVPVNEGVYRKLLAAGVDLIGTHDLAATARLLSPVARPAPDP